MRKTVHKSTSRGFADHGWLKSYHTFSFAGYYNKERTHFGFLRVLNDDLVSPGMGFGNHPHDNMEIVSIPLSGSLAHKDSTGNEHIIKTGDVQIMSAGSGLYHSEYNASKTEHVNFLQIWVFPDKKDIQPRYEQKSFGKAGRLNSIQTVVSPVIDSVSLWINQNAYFSLSSPVSGKYFEYNINSKNNGIYIFVISGSVEIAGEILLKRDAIALENIETAEIAAIDDSEILIIEIPVN